MRRKWTRGNRVPSSGRGGEKKPNRGEKRNKGKKEIQGDYLPKRILTQGGEKNVEELPNVGTKGTGRGIGKKMGTQ